MLRRRLRGLLCLRLTLLSLCLLLQQGALQVLLAADLFPPIVDLRQRHRHLRGLDLLRTPLINPERLSLFQRLPARLLTWNGSLQACRM